MPKGAIAKEMNALVSEIISISLRSFKKVIFLRKSAHARSTVYYNIFFLLIYIIASILYFDFIKHLYLKSDNSKCYVKYNHKVCSFIKIFLQSY